MNLRYTHLLLYFLILVGIQCKTSQSAHQHALPNPPNCVLFSENLYIDRTEMSVTDWREYQFWTQRILSDHAEKILPDTMVWLEKSDTVPFKLRSLGFELSQNYYRHPVYDDYPVVGVSRAQVKAYCDWRTDRVYESMLIKKGAIKYNPNQDSTMYFTAERYLSGNYMGYQPDSSVAIPRFRLPTEAEWELAASGGLDTKVYPYGYNFEEKYNVKYVKKYGIKRLFNSLESPPVMVWSSMKDDSVKMPLRMWHGLENKIALYNMIGNVAEMVEAEGVAKGGGFLTPFNTSTIKDRQTYSKPEKWLGFRCVCTYEKPLGN